MMRGTRKRPSSIAGPVATASDGISDACTSSSRHTFVSG
jgi:hypothetical protein